MNLGKLGFHDFSRSVSESLKTTGVDAAPFQVTCFRSEQVFS